MSSCEDSQRDTPNGFCLPYSSSSSSSSFSSSSSSISFCSVRERGGLRYNLYQCSRYFNSINWSERAQGTHRPVALLVISLSSSSSFPPSPICSFSLSQPDIRIPTDFPMILPLIRDLLTTIRAVPTLSPPSPFPRSHDSCRFPTLFPYALRLLPRTKRTEEEGSKRVRISENGVRG